MAVKKMDELALDGRRVFLRLDLNVPLEEDGNVSDDTRIQAVLPTIEALIERDARVVIATHLGRPKGRRDQKLSVEPVGARLAEFLGNREVIISEDAIGDGPRMMSHALREGQVLLLENLRFYGGETENDDAFAKQLSTLADVYVNDAFGTMHRAHASIVGVPKYLKERGIGLLAARELENLRRLTDKPARPYVAILGGAKVKDKLAVLLNLMGTVDTILVGGAMALTFLAAEGKRLGSSRVELESVGLAEKVLRKAAASNVELLLPVDHIAADRVEHEAHHEAADNDRFPDGRFAVDIGPRTIELFQSRIERAKSVFWNGPMGVFEVEPFNRGTVLLGKAVARSSAFSVVGGGDSVSAIRKGGVAPFISHVSTGGGASLDFIEGKTMPGLAALSEE